ncbi:MAG TPA: ATP-binding protein [Solirubrobacteraceae bacterium]|nr:ATP-binding protein [Solirubrobacteraceae bacterium]
MTLARWFALVVGGLVLAALLGLVIAFVALERQSDRRAFLLDRVIPAEALAGDISTALLDQETSVRGFLLGGEDGFLAPYRAGRREERRALAELQRLQAAVDLAGLRDEHAEIERRAQAWRSQFAEPAIAARRGGGEPPDGEEGKRLFDDVRAAIEAERAALVAERRAAADDVKRGGAQVRSVIIGGGVFVLLAVLVAGYTLRRVVVMPIARLAEAVRVVAQGHFERALEPSGPKEIQELGRDVDAMRARIVAEVGALRDAERALIDQARELQRSNEELEQFAYVASHDLQEPLRKVASFTQMLQRRYAGELDERADRYIEFAVDGARRMQDLINDLLEFSRVGRMTRPHERIPARELLDGAMERLAALLDDAGAEVVVEGDPGVVEGDRGLLTTVFQNLIGNGIKFRGEAPPRVVIQVEPDGRFQRFTITDNGIGVEDEYAERIFVIFQRLHTRDAYEGTGIGLAMCRKIIEYHGGRIALAPAEDGRGARFVFTLPAADPEEETPA